MIATSPAVRNEGKLNPTPAQVQQRQEWWLKNFTSANDSVKLQIMMACCLSHADATAEEAQRVIYAVVDRENTDVIRVYDWPIREA